MNIKRKLLTIAVISAISSTSALANWTPNSTVVINESVAGLLNPANTLGGGDLVYTLNLGAALAVNDIITITLTGGATFANNPQMIGVGAGNPDLGAGVATYNAPLSDATGLSTAQWRLVGGAMGFGDTLQINSSAATDFNLTSVPDNGSVSIKIEASVGAVSLFSQTMNKIFKFGPVVTPTLVFDSDEVKAINTYVDFDGSGTLLSSAASSITFVDNGSTADIPLATPVGVGMFLIKLTGDFSGITKVQLDDVEGSDSAGAGGGTVGEFTINAAKTEAYAVNTGVLGDIGGSNLAVTLDGTTSQEPRKFQVEANIIAADLNYGPSSVLTATDLYEISRDGTFFTTNSVGPLNIIQISDQSGTLQPAGAGIMIKSWDNSGTVLTSTGAATVPTIVNNNATVKVKGADLAANYPTGKRFDFVIDSNDASVSNVKKSPDGMTVTNYRKENKGGTI